MRDLFFCGRFLLQRDADFGERLDTNTVPLIYVSKRYSFEERGRSKDLMQSGYVSEAREGGRALTRVTLR